MKTQIEVNSHTIHSHGPWQNCNDGIYSADGFDCIIEARHVGGKSVDQARANMRLIAAAPEMLRQLKRAQTWISSRSGSEFMTNEIRFVIAKAEGTK
jgi:hypothetical protein